MMESEICSVYLFGYPHATYGHVVKVGISSNVFSRLSSIQCHNPETVIPHFDFIFRSRNLARTIESRFHAHFRHYGIRGEWFGMSERHALFLLTLEVVRALSETYPRQIISEMRKEAGLLRAFAILDDLSDDEQEQWNQEWDEVQGVAA